MFILTKITPPPPVLLVNLTICLCFSLPAQAKIIQRKMHMVCQEHESAYWDGSKGVCCDGNVYQKDENKYACCPTNQFVKNVSGSPYQTCCANDYLSGYILDDVVMCCSNDPNADGQNKQCCTNGGEWTLTQQTGSCTCSLEEESVVGDINIKTTTYSCGGQGYCDVTTPGSQWVLLADLCTIGPSYVKLYGCNQDGKLVNCLDDGAACCGYFIP